MFDYLIVGAGFSGSVIAERIAKILNKKVLIIEKRSHLGGNAFDFYNKDGILVHQYGPHIFHTKIKQVWDYLSQFTEWNYYHHRVLGNIDGKRVPIPFNLNTLQELFPRKITEELEEKLIQYFGYNTKIPILKLREHQDDKMKFLAELIYEKIFVNYTTKQWGMRPEEIDPMVTGRVPIFISKDNRYFQDTYQGIPKDGYTKLFERMLCHSNIKILLNTDYREVMRLDEREKQFYFMNQKFNGKVIYTGKIDDLFHFEFGELPYRSLRFDFETISKQSFQETGTVNYPNEYDFTRITEFKYMTGQQHEKTTIVREFPQAYDRTTPGKNIPYYPIPHPENQFIFKKYWDKAKLYDQLILLGRLAEYKYYDMDACIAKALKVFDQQLLGESKL